MGTMGSGDAGVAGVAERRFLVGQDRQGRWVAVETRDRAGGLFRTRGDALRFADEEAGHRPGSVGLASEPLHLRF